MAVRGLTLQGEEQVARNDAARVEGNARKALIPATGKQTAPDGREDLVQWDMRGGTQMIYRESSQVSSEGLTPLGRTGSVRRILPLPIGAHMGGIRIVE